MYLRGDGMLGKRKLGVYSILVILKSVSKYKFISREVYGKVGVFLKFKTYWGKTVTRLNK